MKREIEEEKQKVKGGRLRELQLGDVSNKSDHVTASVFNEQLMEGA